jgi:hypothetical protein
VRLEGLSIHDAVSSIPIWPTEMARERSRDAGECAFAMRSVTVSMMVCAKPPQQFQPGAACQPLCAGVSIFCVWPEFWLSLEHSEKDVMPEHLATWPSGSVSACR